MILSRNYTDINAVYDFIDGIISDIKWDIRCADLLMTVYYYNDIPEGCKDQDLTIRFKNCTALKMDLQGTVAAMKADQIDNVWQNVESIRVEQTDDSIHVMIETNFSKKYLELSCEEIWIEKEIHNGLQ